MQESHNYDIVLDYLKDRPEGAIAREIYEAVPEVFDSAHQVAFTLRILESDGLVFRERVVGTSYTRYKAAKFNPNKIINSLWRKDGR